MAKTLWREYKDIATFILLLGTCGCTLVQMVLDRRYCTTTFAQEQITKRDKMFVEMKAELSTIVRDNQDAHNLIMTTLATLTARMEGVTKWQDQHSKN